MEKRIVYTNASGGVSIITPAAECRLSVEEVAAKDVPKGVAFEIIDASDIPTDREFRGAWERNGKAIAVSLPKAKDIAHERRRKARAAEFAPLDVEATIPARAQQAEAARQVIRDKYAAMQSAIDAAGSVAEIKAALSGS